MARLAVNLLGGFQASLDPGGPCALPTKRAQALLAYLALAPGRAYPRDTLASLLWGERPDAQARKSLRQTVYALRKAVPGTGDALMLLEGAGIALNPAAIEADVPRFERLVREGTPEALEGAATLYRGELLHGFSLAEVAFEEWLVAERERLREMAIEGLARLLAHQAASTATERGIQTAVRLLALDPLQEAVHRTLMRLYTRQGRRTAALRQYQMCVDLLQRELRTEPEVETKQLYRELVQQRREVRSDEGAASRPLPTRGRVSPRRGRLDLPVQGAPLIGRDAELGRLRTLARQAEKGQGQVAIVLGEAGIGKTRLLAEVATEATERGHEVLVGRAFESEQLLAFGPWVAAIRASSLFEAPGALDALAPPWRSEAARLFPEVAEPGGTGESGGVQDSRRLFEAMERLFSTLADRRPMVLLLEDLHWADEMSLRFLSYLGRRNRAWRVMIVASAREEELVAATALRRAIDELLHDNRCVELTLAPLTRQATVELVRALTRSGGPTSAGLEERIWTASEGNPFMAVEIVRALEQGSEVSPTTAVPAPERVRTLITGRLDRLSARGQHLAAVAAVIGREFEFSLLQQAAGLSGREAAEGVEELVRRRVLHGAAERFDFTHDRIREVAYLRLLPPSRRVLHGEVVRALEALNVGDEEVDRLAHHAVRAQLWDKATRYSRQAGLKALRRSASSEAATALGQALAAVDHLPDDRDRSEIAIDVRLELQSALLPLGQLERMLDYLREAERLAVALDDQRRLGYVSAYLTHCHWSLGQLDLARASGQRALAVASALGDLALEVMANVRLGQVYHVRGQYRDAAAFFRRNADALTGELTTQRFGMPALPAVYSLVALSLGHACLGEFREARAEAENAVLIAERVGHPYSLVFGYCGVGHAHLWQGDLASAISWLERSLELSRRSDFPYLTPWVASHLGKAYTHSGRAGDAIALLEPEATQSAARHLARFHPRIVVWLGEAYLRAGRPAEAQRAIERGLDLLRAQTERGAEAEALWILGEILSARVPLDLGQAEAAYRDALRLAEELAMRPLVARCHESLGSLYGRAGDDLQKQQYLASATALRREMAMRSGPAAVRSPRRR